MAIHRAIANYASPVRPGEDEAALLEQYRSLVDRVARRLVWRIGMHALYDDLWSAGALALLEAARRYDPGKGASFATFAEHRVRGAMIDELRSMDHLPRRLRNRTDDIEKARRKLEEKLVREPTVAEIAAEMALDIDEVAGIAALLEPHLPLDSVLNRISSSDNDYDASLERAETVRRLTRALETLPERLRIVLALHYDEDLTYSEIGRILHVSEPRVCQLHGDALKRLREVMAPEAAEHQTV
ncbi:MAG: FliA/WhiG family RNA polymerase sigma factor [Polyangia bacterium]|jgi:RNA polymerase sigma factor for flagellar operon FliA